MLLHMSHVTVIQHSWKYKVVQIWPGQTVTCLHTNSPGHIWTTLYKQQETTYNSRLVIVHNHRSLSILLRLLTSTLTCIMKEKARRKNSDRYAKFIHNAGVDMTRGNELRCTVYLYQKCVEHRRSWWTEDKKNIQNLGHYHLVFICLIIIIPHCPYWLTIQFELSIFSYEIYKWSNNSGSFACLCALKFRFVWMLLFSSLNNRANTTSNVRPT
jgi:hypothetical protein